METHYPVMVSIFVPTFNHEKYIVRALDSILMQKTRYSYEVLVGEDASTDQTRAVLKAYEAAHPGKLQIFYRQTNMYRQPVSNTMDLKLRCRGKYIIALEGDDFWLDENKLEKQVSFLENHPEYSAVAHNCVVVGEDSLPNGEHYPECKDGEYTFTHFFDRVMPGQFTTFLSRNYMLPGEVDNSLIMNNHSGPGDQLVFFTMLFYGKIRCMQEPMSAYRYITAGGSSFSANHKYHYASSAQWHNSLLQYARKQGRLWPVCNAEALCISNLLTARSLGQVSGEDVRREIKALPHPLLAGYLWLWRGLKRRLVRLLTPGDQQTFSQRQL